mmetsp:Transcript_61447/g.143027  ORF Transcript_61447/g.143027 Transcript_61447/m.143027 type:complete len:233 (+) Transcript_61447:211-909(+)
MTKPVSCSRQEKRMMLKSSNGTDKFTTQIAAAATLKRTVGWLPTSCVCFNTSRRYLGRNLGSLSMTLLSRSKMKYKDTATIAMSSMWPVKVATFRNIVTCSMMDMETFSIMESHTQKSLLAEVNQLGTGTFTLSRKYPLVADAAPVTRMSRGLDASACADSRGQRSCVRMWQFACEPTRMLSLHLPAKRLQTEASVVNIVAKVQAFVRNHKGDLTPWNSHSWSVFIMILNGM